MPRDKKKLIFISPKARLTQSTDDNRPRRQVGGNIMQTIYDTKKVGLVSEITLIPGADAC